MNNPIIKLTNANAERIDELDPENINGFVNDLVNKFFNGNLVELDDENKMMIDKLAAEADKTSNQVVNKCLSSATFALLNHEKPTIEIDRPPLTVKKKRRSDNNPAVNW